LFMMLKSGKDDIREFLFIQKRVNKIYAVYSLMNYSIILLLTPDNSF
jgi:hypothetical protein